MDHQIRLLTGGNFQPDRFLEADQLSDRLIRISRAHHFLEDVLLNDVRHVVGVDTGVGYRLDRAINLVHIRWLVQYSRSTLVAFRATFSIHRLCGGLMRADVDSAFLICGHSAVQCGCEAGGRCAIAGR